ncbi:hypothetical protein BJY04DRAFT_22524 [Aspergillus karnatakaensis]|uniref:CCCH zinc finger protein n=1 Tax=Aspergillus karnatakaensis TaxID=1810916 RepID=UPI003CCCB25C
MNPQGFSFPPPPPPPPVQQHQPQQQYSHNAAYTPYGQNQHGQRGGRGGGGGGNFRGRGRGHGNRGGGRGGHFASDANRSATYSTNNVGYGPMTHSAFPNQHMPNPQTGTSAPHYTQSSAQNFQAPLTGTSYASASHYSQPTAHGAPYQHQPSYAASYAHPATQQQSTYNHAMPSHQHAHPTTQAAMMGPPMRWGFENAGYTGSFNGPQRPNQRGPRQANTYNHQQPSNKQTNKRDHSSAFGKPQSVVPRVPAPPPVPSFGNPLPSKPPVPADSPRKSKKKRRKHNQLGLTPKTEDHESSEEEDDADEESRLIVADGPGSALQVTYKGRTAKLQTSAEIAAWIEERKKRFPTQAKIEERKKAMDEAKKAKQEAQQKQKEARKQATARNKKEREQPRQKEPPRETLDPADAAAKAKQKAEKLRRKLMKEEKRIAQAEADAARARKETQPGSLEATDTPTTEKADDANHALLSTGAEDASQAQQTSEKQDYTHGGQVDSDSVSEMSDSSDWTSSSGSDLSSDSDPSDDNSAPEQATSRREGPERVPPPARDEKKKVCRNFARSGRCPRGKTCKFLHEKSERAVKPKPAEPQGRKGLLQALLDRQKEDENRKLMETIVWLGENGLLDEPAVEQPQMDASSGTIAPTIASGAGPFIQESQNHTEIGQPPENMEHEQAASGAQISPAAAPCP